jgi:endonuclease I
MSCYIRCAGLSKFPRQLLDWAIEVAASEQVTFWEKHRNSQLFRLQRNHNPFIDFPNLANKIDFLSGYIQKLKH